MIAPHEKTALEEQLVKLHEVLEEHPPIRDETRDLLLTVALDISRELGETKPTSTDWQELGQRWKSIVSRFETKHPQLTRIIDQVTTTLANTGI